MKQELLIEDVSESETKTGKPMWILESKEEEFYIFNINVANELIKNIGMICELEIIISKGYSNITQFFRVVGAPPKTTNTDTNPAVIILRNDKQKSICVGYANQWAAAKLQALIPKTKDLLEAKSLADEIKMDIEKDSKEFFRYFKNLE